MIKLSLFSDSERHVIEQLDQLCDSDSEHKELFKLVREKLLTCFDALKFYADPETYHACSFLFDKPTGGFDEDFDESHGHSFYDQPMPGSLARKVLNHQVINEEGEEWATENITE